MIVFFSLVFASVYIWLLTDVSVTLGRVESACEGIVPIPIPFIFSAWKTKARSMWDNDVFKYAADLEALNETDSQAKTNMHPRKRLQGLVLRAALVQHKLVSYRWR
jgi:hypothetical protein